MNLVPRTTCRVCGSDRLQELFSLGQQYISNFLSREQRDAGNLPHCEITLQLCSKCSLIQQKYTAPQDFLYSRQYWYRSGVTDTMRTALMSVALSAILRVKLEEGDVVLDIGANDGTLLSNYADDRGIVRVACEPAQNLHLECATNCEILIKDFWSAEKYLDQLASWGLGTRLDDAKAKIITAIGMFYDLEDPNQFIGDVAKVLHPEGLFVCQLMCAKQMLMKGDIGNLAHEHLEFYTLKSLEILFSKHGLSIVDIEENDVNGGSYRIYVRHATTVNRLQISADAVGHFHIERELGIQDASTWKNWFKAQEKIRLRLVRYITEDANKCLYVYGASTKGNVILQWLNLARYYFAGAADRSPEKWGRFMVAGNIPIHSEQHFRLAGFKHALVLPYGFINEFVKREEAWLSVGGTFIVPFPEPYTITKEGIKPI